MKRAGRLMIMAGGTGGHVFPALAVAQSMRAQGAEVTWLGTRRGLEAKVIPANDIPIEWVGVEGLRGKGLISLISAPFKLLRAMWQSANAIRRINPDCILGMGGFVAGPGGLVARLMRRPLVIHEQNAVAGLTNRYLAFIADRVLTGFPNVEQLPATAEWVGNPVRDTIRYHSPDPEFSRVNVLVVGGSQGAQSFNDKLPAVFAALSDKVSHVSVWHQAGRGRADSVIARYEAADVDAKVSEFIDDMAAAYRWADLLFCRAGAMTIAECCAAGRPALLIPYPYSAGDHQVKNAQVMVDVGAAKMLRNDQLDQPELQAMLQELLRDKKRLMSMGQRALRLHKPQALADVTRICLEYLHA